jgi:hypothetical protein
MMTQAQVDDLDGQEELARRRKAIESQSGERMNTQRQAVVFTPEYTKEDHKFAVSQALASARLEGYEPDEESLKLLTALAEGKITTEEYRHIVVKRALKAGQ